MPSFAGWGKTSLISTVWDKNSWQTLVCSHLMEPYCLSVILVTSHSIEYLLIKHRQEFCFAAPTT